ncbi:hypothetical protein BKA62DRAFT_307134 [Auriculariales sp. MPI-PUGE-AT-0066]|nr:hypothetical protein BKA62DRAFT_307134 [Auriculariales sp. MPI-PUGE-AT-0066]
MDTLPTELFQEVFAFAVGSPKDVHLHSDIAPLTIAGILAPYRLAAVCTAWRAICLQTAELWAYVQLGDCAPTHVSHYTALHLSRSAEHPLDVWAADFASVADDHDVYYALLEPIIENAYRWRRVRLCFPQYAPFRRLLAPCSSMPALQSLVFITGSVRSNKMVGDEDEEPEEMDILSNSPRLTYLAKHVLSVAICTSMNRLQYLSVSLRDTRRDTFLWRALAMTPNLKELEIYFPFYSGIEADPELHTKEISLPQLHQLSVYGFPPENETPWIDKLHMPRLEKLVCSIESCDYLAPVYAKVRKEVRHVVITSVETRPGGYFCDLDARSLDRLSSLDTLELRGITQLMFKEHNQSFFDHLIGGFEDETRTQPAWAAGFEHLILRDCTVYFNACRMLAHFVNMRESAAREGGQPFDFQVHDCMFLATRAQEPVAFEPVRSHFANSMFYGESPHSYYPGEEDDEDDEKYGAKWSVELLEELILRGDQPESDDEQPEEAATTTSSQTANSLPALEPIEEEPECNERSLAEATMPTLLATINASPTDHAVPV